ncbi:hypothetical protein BRYFOR_08273 [Marvinbryantia formatexigens DSM 14469]|uniref:Uncharacterized protein n=1 Tax=Marvinbryantia formatexigens DSM 14469 TaxID=478749 RepID=C6LI02_9FIRM|nr:hypothetical protein BRYFOR_08273 [Marvinbryantia formatexigens DSM 14469]
MQILVNLAEIFRFCEVLTDFIKDGLKAESKRFSAFIVIKKE